MKSPVDAEELPVESILDETVRLFKLAMRKADMPAANVLTEIVRRLQNDRLLPMPFIMRNKSTGDKQNVYK